MTQQNLINGFVKRAYQHGLNDQEINDLLKVAAPTLQEIWNGFKGYASEAGGLAKKHLVDPVMETPEHWNKMRGIAESQLTYKHYEPGGGLYPTSASPEEQAAFTERFKQKKLQDEQAFKGHLGGFARGVGTAGAGIGAAGLGAYGAGKMLFGGPSAPPTPQTMQPNIPQQLQQQ